MNLNHSLALCAQRNGMFTQAEVDEARLPEGKDETNLLDIAEWLMEGKDGAVRCLKADAWLNLQPSREVLETVLRCMCGLERPGEEV